MAGAGPPSRINMENCTCRHSKSPAPAIQALSLDKHQPLALSSPQFAWRELVSSDRLSLMGALPTDTDCDSSLRAEAALDPGQTVS